MTQLSLYPVQWSVSYCGHEFYNGEDQGRAEVWIERLRRWGNKTVHVKRGVESSVVDCYPVTDSAQG